MRSLVARSCSENFLLRLRGTVGALGMHSARALMQFEHGFCLSHLTLRCWHRIHEWPRVILVTTGGAASGVIDGDCNIAHERGSMEPLINYVEEAAECRSRRLLDSFGDAGTTGCCACVQDVHSSREMACWGEIRFQHTWWLPCRRTKFADRRCFGTENQPPKSFHPFKSPRE